MYITCCFWFKSPECLVTDVLLFCHSCGYEKVFSDQENQSDLQPSWFKLSSPPPRTKNTAFAYCRWLITVGGSLNGSAVINSDKRLLPNWSWIWSPLTDLTSSPYSHWPSSLLTLPSDQHPLALTLQLLLSSQLSGLTRKSLTHHNERHINSE